MTGNPVSYYVAPDPNFLTEVVIVPRGGRYVVIDFWSGFFLFEPTADQQAIDAVAREFRTKLENYMTGFGYRRLPYMAKELVVSFSGGLLGVARPMLVYENKRAKAMVVVKQMGRLYYVSLRTVYDASFSLLKILWFIFRAFLLGIVMRFLDIYDVEFVRVDNVYDLFTLSFGSYYLGGTLVMLGVAAVVLLFVLGFWSQWRSGRFWGFVRENFNEHYLDDIASIGEAAYLAIHQVADELSLKQTLPSQQPQRPAFGSGGVTSGIQRKPRI